MKCKQCSHELRTGHSFCTQCGAAIEGKIKRMNIHQYASVLCTDVKGSTALVADLDPEEAYTILRPVIAKVIESIEYYGGIVVRTAGDGVIAAFGVPEKQKNHALCACLAGIRMQKEIQATQKKLAIRVGINSGDLVMMPVGSQQHFEYDVTGAVISIASRMEQTGSSTHVKVSSDTLKLINSYFDTGEGAPVEVKGVNEKIEGFDLLNLKTTHPTEALQTFNFFPFISREKEMERLEILLKRAKEEETVVLGLSGNLGYGKTRLIQEFLNSDTVDGYFIWRHRQGSTLDLSELQSGIVENCSQEKSIILIFEDIHLLADEAQQLLSSFLEKLKNCKIFILLSYESTYKTPWGQMENYFEWKLPLLSHNDQRLIIDDILGDDFSLEEVKQKILLQADGDLFFLQAMVLWLIEHKKTVEKEGNYQFDATDTSKTISPPKNLKETLIERIKQLPQQQKQLLHAVSSIESDISLNDLAAAVHLDIKTALKEIRILVKKCYLFQKALLPDLFIALTHPLLREILQKHFAHFQPETAKE